MSSDNSSGVLPGFSFLNDSVAWDIEPMPEGKTTMKWDRERTMTASIGVDDDIVSQKLDINGTVSYRFVNLAADQMDKAIHDHLVKLGWTPPTNNKTGS